MIPYNAVTVNFRNIMSVGKNTLNGVEGGDGREKEIDEGKNSFIE
jgi:hypothetical protein